MLAAGCGEGSRLAGEGRACDSLRIVVAQAPRVERASDAPPALRRVLRAERSALDALPENDERAAALRGAIARAERTLSSIAVDPLRSGTMSPTATVVPGTRRVLAEARSLADRLCGR